MNVRKFADFFSIYSCSNFMFSFSFLNTTKSVVTTIIIIHKKLTISDGVTERKKPPGYLYSEMAKQCVGLDLKIRLGFAFRTELIISTFWMVIVPYSLIVIMNINLR